MKNSKLLLYSLGCSLGLVSYILLVSWFMSGGANHTLNNVPDFMAGTMILILFVFSALVSALLVLGGPIWFYLEKQKKTALKMLSMNIFWILFIFCLIVLFFVFVNSNVNNDQISVNDDETNVGQVDNFSKCAKAGNPVMESYPRQCRYGDKTFTEYIGNELEKADLIKIDNPRPNQIVSSPLEITGEARGTWFFEASFPIILTDWDGRIIAEGYATARGDWMTEDFVQFDAQLEFEKPELYNRGSLILQRDNPSGLAKNDDALEIPVFFE